MTPWSKIQQYVPTQRTVQGWYLIDGYNYTQEGLVPEHLWQWRKLRPSYVFPATNRPRYCYVDIVAYCWEHEGMQGFGLRTPHGHTALEFGDDAGNFWSVGLYMDPRSSINIKTQPGAKVRAAMMSSDPYLASLGEKTVHRYHVGSGSEGCERIQKLRKHLESIQGWRKDPETGIISTCRRQYSMFEGNCGDFVKEIEEYTMNELDGKLTKIDENAVLAPGRRLVTKSNVSWIQDLYTNIFNRMILLFVDILIVFIVHVPWFSSKIGVGRHDDFSDHDQVEDHKEGSSFKSMFIKRLSDLKSKAPAGVSFPVKMRVEQLYSPRLKNYSVKIIA